MPWAFRPVFLDEVLCSPFAKQAGKLKTASCHSPPNSSLPVILLYPTARYNLSIWYSTGRTCTTVTHIIAFVMSSVWIPAYYMQSKCLHYFPQFLRIYTDNSHQIRPLPPPLQIRAIISHSLLKAVAVDAELLYNSRTIDVCHRRMEDFLSRLRCWRRAEFFLPDTALTPSAITMGLPINKHFFIFEFPQIQLALRFYN
jgi:hypothetical protein